VHPHKPEDMLATGDMANPGVTQPPSASAGPPAFGRRKPPALSDFRETVCAPRAVATMLDTWRAAIVAWFASGAGIMRQERFADVVGIPVQ
jgi:hypothetical protein